MSQDQQEQFSASNASDNIKKETKDDKKVTYEDDNPTTSSAPPMRVSTIMQEIDRLTKEIEELQIRNIGSDDPEYKESAKKLLQIRKYLTNKTKPTVPSTASNFWKKVKALRHRRGHLRPSSMEPTPSEMLEIETEQGGASNYLNYTADEAFLYGAECMLSLLDMIRARNQ